MADEPNSIEASQRLEKLLKSIEESGLIYSTSLTVHVNLVTCATEFEKFSKTKIEFSDFEIVPSSLKTVDLNGNENQAELAADSNVLDGENPGPSKFLISTEDFIDRLKQYTQSKLKSLKKQSKSLKKKNSSSIFEIVEKESSKTHSESTSKAKQPSKTKSPSSKPKAEIKPKNTNLKECVDCKQMKPHKARDRCGTCYGRFMRQKKKEDAEKAKLAEQAKENSSQHGEVQANNPEQSEAASDKQNKKKKRKKEDAEKAKLAEQAKEKSSQDGEVQESKSDQLEAGSDEPKKKKKRTKKESTDDA